MAMTRDALLEYMNQKLGVDTDTLTDDTPLFSSGLLDSFTLLEVVTFIESQAGVKMRPTEINLDNLDSVDRILAFAGSHA